MLEKFVVKGESKSKVRVLRRERLGSNSVEPAEKLANTTFALKSRKVGQALRSHPVNQIVL